MNRCFFYSLLLWICGAYMPVAVGQNAHVPGEILVWVEDQAALNRCLEYEFEGYNQAVPVYRYEHLTPALNIYRFYFEPELISDIGALRQFRSIKGVLHAQWNHYLEERKTETTFPNDPLWINQWNLHNTGQGTGLADADIDAPEAWDITTGGLSVLGDTIVVAVIDKGVDLTHTDLQLWKNHAEIPGDGIDNDLNSYVDDVDGWNPTSNNDAIPANFHGTHVSGIVGAKGNNSVGTSGVNWNVQIMPLVNLLAVEAEVVAAYGYVLQMRRLYNQTQGAKGAFIVATNTSFGVNLGLPVNFPIWCAMYDSLGAEGILSAVATTNTPKNVDLVGDIPSTCGSDYVISVTNTTSQDVLSGGAGFGSIHIDLGAPGTMITSTVPGNAWGLQSGTSMATPHVSGSIALLYAAACPAFMIQHKLAPAASALWIKDYILQSTDSLPSLVGKSVSGGRLNVHQAILFQQQACASLNADCVIPFGIQQSHTDSSAFFSWAVVDSAVSYTYRYRKVQDSVWTYGQSTPPEALITGLDACTDYEIQLQSICGADSSGYLSTISFQTEGCCEAPVNIKHQTLTDTSALFSWDGVFGATAYELLIALNGSNNWDTIVSNDTFYTILNLIPCESYVFKLGTRCDSLVKQYSPEKSFDNIGCGFCVDANYCASSAVNATLEWIEAVEIGPVSHKSGPNSGYAAFTNPVFEFVKDSIYEVKLIPGYQLFNYNEFWQIWIDLNQDGIFGTDEQLFPFSDSIKGEITAQIYIPDSVLTGSTRMRVSMKYGGPTGGRGVPEACEQIDFGEVEDYCITISDPTNLSCPNADNLMLNYFADAQIMQVSFDASTAADDYVLRLTQLSSGEITEFFLASSGPIFNVILDDCQEYHGQIRSICGDFGSGFTPIFAFETPNCGACIDSAYCEAGGSDSSLVWIKTVQIGDVFSHTSGFDNGYGDFTQLSIDLFNINNFPAQVFLEPAFSGDPFPVYWAIIVDFNENGQFEADTETLFRNTVGDPDTLQRFVLNLVDLPLFQGPSRVRVVLRADTLPASCGQYQDGEVQDYCASYPYILPIDPILPLPEIKIFPNPAQESLSVEASDRILSYQLFDLRGKNLLNKKAINQDNFDISLLPLQAGYYIIRLETAQGMISKKFVKLE